ncbi:1-phosphofructokinase family hexose kinase [Agathobaculum sp.]|uniref:1-phosphofructokinase family hexose kinase n=1 Tax=Agathobaculum sp. TaxID=2048138 RepID=UPI002A837FD4|nr:1-phosphofructokinase family hexose kinase [Agathobaculum sp.]MDY3618318.1 1-phosphofructokinase family hexose kinase [Agathobaculum sp.]
MIITITLNTALDRTLRIEQPLQVGKLNRAVSSYLEPGGKGINVSRAVKALGGDSIALGFCAGTNGRIIKDALTAADIHHDFVDLSGQTRVNTQIIDAQGGHTEINEPGSKLEDADFLRFLDRMDNYLDAGNIFVLAGSCPPDFPLQNYRKICKKIKKAGCRLIIDAQGELMLEALQCEPDFVKPNIFELAEAVGEKPSADPDVVLVSARKMLEMGARAVCVSMAQEGALLVAKDEPEALYANCNPKIYDEGSVGTGDAMVGAIANSMHKGLRFDEMARFAVAAARASARLPGTEMATLKKVYEVYETTEVYTL